MMLLGGLFLGFIAWMCALLVSSDAEVERMKNPKQYSITIEGKEYTITERN